MKIKMFLLVIVIPFVGLGCGNSLSEIENRGYSFLANQMNSPSTLVLLEYISASQTAEIFRQGGWELEPYQKAVTYIVEGTNNFGGRIKKSYVVFFVDGNPIDYVESDQLNKFNIDNVKTFLRINGFYK